MHQPKACIAKIHHPKAWNARYSSLKSLHSEEWPYRIRAFWVFTLFTGAWHSLWFAQLGHLSLARSFMLYPVCRSMAPSKASPKPRSTPVGIWCLRTVTSFFPVPWKKSWLRSMLQTSMPRWAFHSYSNWPTVAGAGQEVTMGLDCV